MESPSTNSTLSDFMSMRQVPTSTQSQMFWEERLEQGTRMSVAFPEVCTSKSPICETEAHEEFHPLVLQADYCPYER